MCADAFLWSYSKFCFYEKNILKRCWSHALSTLYKQWNSVNTDQEKCLYEISYIRGRKSVRINRVSVRPCSTVHSSNEWPWTYHWQFNFNNQNRFHLPVKSFTVQRKWLLYRYYLYHFTIWHFWHFLIMLLHRRKWNTMQLLL